MSLRTFAIQQLSSVLMHATPNQPKYYIIILLSYAGWCCCHWQGYGCLCVCMCVGGPTLLSWLELSAFTQPASCIAFTHFLSLYLSLSISPSFPRSISGIPFPSFSSFFSFHLFLILQPPGECPTMGTFTADPFFTLPPNWTLMHCSIKSPSLKGPSMD